MVESSSTAGVNKAQLVGTHDRSYWTTFLEQYFVKLPCIKNSIILDFLGLFSPLVSRVVKEKIYLALFGVNNRKRQTTFGIQHNIRFILFKSAL